MMAEKFSTAELTNLRSELLQSGLDAWDVARVFQMFLVGRGYGVSPEAAWDAASRVEGAGCSLDAIQKELEGIAMVM
jgi:hypothetical protein